SYGNNPKMIVLHHAEASKCSIEDIHRWHLNNGWAGCGYHYFIDKQGNIWIGRPDDAIGAHTAGSNTNTLGVCAEGSYNKEAMPEIQKKAIIELCKYLCNKYDISSVKGHGELMATDCPGKNYPLEEIKNAINGGYAQKLLSLTSPLMYGEDIKDLQRDLATLGLNISVDGYYGNDTVNAVKEFQRLHTWLSIDGIVGEQTKKAIKDSVAKKLKANTNKKSYKVQVGSFENKVYAENLLKEIKSKGYKDAYIKEI
ncbi:N-acetylmuramoyl-L-alanine amidase, partial [uncultured Clostridium sp.]|uniref:N-acetylmuramoyl-L-alanine amidase n=1 Tax=uncultured Clostridium sp. TaxID=59620 RepID=UPI0028EA7D07